MIIVGDFNMSPEEMEDTGVLDLMGLKNITVGTDNTCKTSTGSSFCPPIHWTGYDASYKGAIVQSRCLKLVGPNLYPVVIDLVVFPTHQPFGGILTCALCKASIGNDLLCPFFGSDGWVFYIVDTQI